MVLNLAIRSSAKSPTKFCMQVFKVLLEYVPHGTGSFGNCSTRRDETGDRMSTVRHTEVLRKVCTHLARTDVHVSGAIDVLQRPQVLLTDHGRVNSPLSNAQIHRVEEELGLNLCQGRGWDQWASIGEVDAHYAELAEPHTVIPMSVLDGPPV